MPETYAKYSDMEQVPTCLLIDEAPVVLMGRTFFELVATIVSFVVFAYFDEVGLGAALAVVVGVVMPSLRARFPRGYLLHLLWSFGVVFRELQLFSVRRGVKVMGP
jgi:hypothetical protein